MTTTHRQYKIVSKDTNVFIYTFVCKACTYMIVYIHIKNVFDQKIQKTV